MTHEIIFADVYCVVSKIQNPDFRCHVTQELNGPPWAQKAIQYQYSSVENQL